MFRLTMTFVLAAAISPQREEGITLEDAIARALARNPEIAASAWAIRAMEGRGASAGRLPNPSVSVSIENVGGDVEGLDDSEITVSLGQVLELGSKRGARADAARAGVASAGAAHEARKRLVAAEVARAFIDGLHAADAVALRRDEEGIAEGIVASTAARVRAGAVSPAEEARAELDLERVRLARREAEEALTVRHATLSALWAEPVPRFATLQGSLDSLEAVPERDALIRRLETSPEVGALLREAEARRREAALARAERTPDVEVGAGVRRLPGGDKTFLAELSVEVPIWDRGSGLVGAADAQVGAAEADVDRARTAAARELAAQHATLARLQAKIRVLRGRILPAAQRAYEAIGEGYERGRFGYVDLLEARRTLTETRQEEIDALKDYHLAVASIELLLGEPIHRRSDEEVR